MADVQPFRGLRYNPQVAPDLGKVLCPPYDVISPQLQEALYQRSPYNMVRLEFGKEAPAGGDRYAAAARTLGQWRAQRVLVAEEEPAFYLLQQQYADAQGRRRARRVLLGRVRLEEFSKGVVLPHEETAEGPKRDRLALLSACQANLSPIMGLYRDPSGRIAQGLREAEQQVSLYQTSTSEGEALALWPVTGSRATALREALAPLPIYLADGHHRYETALHYRNLQGGQGQEEFQFVLMGLLDLADPGLQVQGYHRLVGGLEDVEASLTDALDRSFQVVAVAELPQEVAAAAERVRTLLEQAHGPERVMGLADQRGRRLRLVALREEARARLARQELSPPGAPPRQVGDSAPRTLLAPELVECDPWALQETVLNPLLAPSPSRQPPMLEYVHEEEEALRQLHDGRAQVAFLLRPLPLELFERVVRQGVRLPRKSTYFTPKLPTGLVVYAFGV